MTARKTPTGRWLVLSAKGNSGPEYLAGRYLDRSEAEDHAEQLREEWGEDARVVAELS